MQAHLKYGRGALTIDLPDAATQIIEPLYQPGEPDEREAVLKALRRPIGTPPLREIISSSESVAIVIPDGTRPFPGSRVVPWVLEELSHIPAQNLVIINGTGSHRANTEAELQGMLGEEIVRAVRIVNHDAHNPQSLLTVGSLSSGQKVLFNREYVQADRRVLLGFVEPHFMAGFSGGYKAAAPGLMGIDNILHFHSAALVGDVRSTWGVLDGNPTQSLSREAGALVPVDFNLNVTLNRDRQITGVFAGDIIQSHNAACAFSKKTAMRPVEKPFDVVVTTNGGFPLDQNLYQAVKGMSAARQITARAGLIVSASECSDGFPEHGNFKSLLFDHASPAAILDTINSPGFCMFDQWEAQLLAQIAGWARVALHSTIPAEEVRRAHLEPVDDVARRVLSELKERGEGARVAVLPEGPFTIPYVQ